MHIAVSTRVLGFIAIALIAIGIVGCHSYAPNAGHEIVLIQKPIFFGHGGVDPNPVRTGRTYAAISTDGVDVNMQPQKFETELIDFPIYVIPIQHAFLFNEQENFNNGIKEFISRF